MKKTLILVSILFLSAGCNPFSNPGVLGVVKTLDGGGAWQASNVIDSSKSDISGLAVTEMSFDPGNHEHLYLASTNGGLWQSTNSGMAWKQMLSRVTVYDFFVDPQNTQNIFAVGIYNNHGLMLRTHDAGATWEQIYNEASNDNSVNTITANPNNSQELYAALNTGVVIKTTDGGNDWFVVQDFKDQALKLRFDPHNHALYGLFRTKGLQKSTDGGLHWSDLTSSVTGGSANFSLSIRPIESFNRMALDDQNAGIIYLTTSAGLYKTTDDGKSWSYLNIPVRSSAQEPKAIASTHAGVLAYTSIGNTIFKSLDGGKSWQTQPLPTTNDVSKILIDPNLPQITYAGLINAQ